MNGNKITSSIYGSRSYMKWQYGGVRHGTSAGKRRDTAFGVLVLLGPRALWPLPLAAPSSTSHGQRERR